MLWREPVHKDRNLERWLKIGNFPTGIVEAALEAKAGKPKQEFLTGCFFHVPTKTETKLNQTVGKLLKMFGPHADQADFLVGSQVPYLLRESREAPDGSSFKRTFEESDILVIEAFFSLEDYELRDIDRRLSARAYAPPRITIVTGKLPDFESVSYSFRNKFQKV